MIKAFPQQQLVMMVSANEQLLFEQYIRGFPKTIYGIFEHHKHITLDEYKRAQIFIRLESDLGVKTLGTTLLS